jgi:site-specific DNA-methyltransferase (adenine-specific)
VTVERGDGWELHLADWRSVDLPRVDAVIEDPPYGERTHAGQRHERASGFRGSSGTKQVARNLVSDVGLQYEHLTHQDVIELVERGAGLCDGWMLSMMSHDLIPVYESALAAIDRYTFAPLPIVLPGMNVRLAGDGPSNWTVHLLVSRTKVKKCWSTKPGAYNTARDYVAGKVAGHSVSGGKPLGLMEALVSDYTDKGDLVMDRFAGGGTTGVACIRTGRRFIGCERKPEHFAIAVKRLRAAREQLTMFGDGRSAAGAGE